MALITVENTGERFIPSQCPPLDVIVNLERYLFAAHKCQNQTVLELGCGSGLGTYLYSLVAKHVTAVDYSYDAIKYAQTYPMDKEKVDFIKMDLTKDLPTGKFDVTVATEFLEHIDDPASLIEKLNTKLLVFSLPLSSMSTSAWHKYNIRAGEEGIEDIKKLISKRYTIETLEVQKGETNCRWVFGVARKRKSWFK